MDDLQTHLWRVLEPGVVLKRTDESEKGTTVTLIEVKQVLARVVRAEVIRLLSQTGEPTTKQVIHTLTSHEIYSSPNDLSLAARPDLDNRGIYPTHTQMLTVCNLAYRGAQHVSEHADDELDRQVASAFLSVPLQFQDPSAVKGIAYYAEAALFLTDMSQAVWAGPGPQVLSLEEARTVVQIVKDALIEMYVPLGLIWEAQWISLQKALMNGTEMSISLDRVPGAQFAALASCPANERSFARPFLQLTFNDGQPAETVNLYLNTKILHWLNA